MCLKLIHLSCTVLIALQIISCQSDVSDKENKAVRTNFIFIIGDDISDADLGCYGHPYVRTPHIDRLARNGLRFTNAYLTASQCSPTRCSIITGRYPHNTGAPELHMELPDGQPLFPLELKTNGYYCVQSGKWHIGESAVKAFDRVFELEDAGPGGEERWVRCIRERPRGKPFFMWFASSDAHRDWQADSICHPHHVDSVLIPPYMADMPDSRDDMANYYNEIQRLDHYVGEVVKELQAQGVLDHTVIIIMADNGRPFPRDKTWLYNSGVRTPFIVHWPDGISGPGQVSDAFLSAIDIAPTILELAGIKSPDGFQGISFLPLINDPDASICNFVFAEENWHTMRAHMRMVRFDDYLYIRNAYHELCHLLIAQQRHPAFQDLLKLKSEGRLTIAQNDVFLEPRQAEELYRVSTDSLQLSNLANNPEFLNILERGRTLINEWQDKTGDTEPILSHGTPERYSRQTKERLYPGWRPPTGELPGDSRGAQSINNPGPR